MTWLYTSIDLYPDPLFFPELEIGGKIMLGWNQSKLYKPGFKHWKEVLENPRRPIIKWHVLQVKNEVRKNEFRCKSI